MVHLGETISWHPPSTYRLLALHPAALLGDTRELGGHKVFFHMEHIKARKMSGEVGGHSGYGTTHSSYGTTLVGCRGGNRYVEGDLLTFGYLMLDDSLGYYYYRLFNVGQFPWIPLLSAI